MAIQCTNKTTILALLTCLSVTGFGGLRSYWAALEAVVLAAGAAGAGAPTRRPTTSSNISTENRSSDGPTTTGCIVVRIVGPTTMDDSPDDGLSIKLPTPPDTALPSTVVLAYRSSISNGFYIIFRLYVSAGLSILLTTRLDSNIIAHIFLELQLSRSAGGWLIALINKISAHIGLICSPNLEGGRGVSRRQPLMHICCLPANVLHF